MKSFRMKCIDNRNNKTDYTIGKIYIVVNGIFMTDGENLMPTNSFEDWESYSSSIWELLPDIPKEFCTFKTRKRNMNC